MDEVVRHVKMGKFDCEIVVRKVPCPPEKRAGLIAGINLLFDTLESLPDPVEMFPDLKEEQIPELTKNALPSLTKILPMDHG